MITTDKISKHTRCAFDVAAAINEETHIIPGVITHTASVVPPDAIQITYKGSASAADVHSHFSAMCADIDALLVVREVWRPESAKRPAPNPTRPYSRAW